MAAGRGRSSRTAIPSGSTRCRSRRGSSTCSGRSRCSAVCLCRATSRPCGRTTARLEPNVRRLRLSPRAIILGYELWQQQFSGRLDVVGTTARFAGTSVEIVGVMPRGFGFTDMGWGEQAAAWVPDVPDSQQRRARYRRAIGRLAPGVSMETARAEFDVIARRLADAYPRANAGRAYPPVESARCHRRETRGRCSGSCSLQPRPSWSSHAPTWPTCCSPMRRGAVSSSPRAWPWARAADISCVRRSPRPCVSAASQVLADCSWRTSRCRGSCGWLRLNCRGSPRSRSTSVSSSSRSA